MGYFKKIKMRTFILLLALCAIANSTSLRQIMSSFQVNTHYKSPFPKSYYHMPGRCTGSNETSVPIHFVSEGGYSACMPTPVGSDNLCPGDTPLGNTAVPAPIFNYKDPKTKEISVRCGLVCTGRAIGICALGAECVIATGTAVGYCVYKDLP